MDDHKEPRGTEQAIPETTDQAREYLVEWHKANWKHAPYFSNHIRTEMAGDFAFHLARWLARQATPEAPAALIRYKEHMQDCDELTPVERLRFFCSLAMNGQDWLDVEPFFDALAAVPATTASASQEAQAAHAGANDQLLSVIWRINDAALAALPRHPDPGVMRERYVKSPMNALINVESLVRYYEEARSAAIATSEQKGPQA